MPILLCAILLAAGPTAGVAADPPTRTFEIVASRFKFEPSVIEVSEGDHVVLKLRSADVVHGFAIKALKKSVLIPKDGSVVTLELVAPAPGRFVFACSHDCGSGHERMKGTLVVHERTR